MKKSGKILSTAFKILIGLCCFWIIWLRLRNDLSADRIAMIAGTIASYQSIAALLLCMLLIPVNWGMESCKWQLITAPVEQISYRIATTSVYSGVFLGNFAPARATQFLAKVMYFQSSNRPQVTVLHFLSGMFQLAVTLLAGFAAMLLHMSTGAWSDDTILYVTSLLAVVFCGALCVTVFKIDPILNYLTRKISRDHSLEKFEYRFSKQSLFRMTGYSMIRYLVFYGQFVLLLSIFSPAGISVQLLAGIAIYFLVTTLTPMIGIFEGAIRAAIALVIFRDSGISDAAVALTSVVLWLVNIILPSITGYYFLLRQNFNFKVFRASR